MTRDDVFELHLFLSAVTGDIISSAKASGMGVVQPAYIPVLCAIAEKITRVGDIAERLDITQQAVGKTLRHMKKDSLITIGPDEHDGRVKRARLTAQGDALLRVFDAVADNWDAE